jgi:hypothetical protein
MYKKTTNKIHGMQSIIFFSFLSSRFCLWWVDPIHCLIYKPSRGPSKIRKYVVLTFEPINMIFCKKHPLDGNAYCREACDNFSAEGWKEIIVNER